MRRIVSRFLWVVPVLLLGACASAGGGGDEGGPAVGKITFAAGQGMQGDIDQKLRRVLSKYQYEIYRTEPTPHLYVETYWKDRYPFADEEAQGLGAGKTRLLFRTRVRQRSKAGELLAVSITAENLVRQEDGGEWVPIEPTEEFRKYVKRIAEDLKVELESGLRTF